MTLDKRHLADQGEKLDRQEARLLERHYQMQKSIDALRAKITDLMPYQPHQPDLKELESEYERAAIAAEMRWRSENCDR